MIQSTRLQPNEAEPMQPKSDDDSLFAEASAWFIRLNAEDVTQTERDDFVLWLETSPRHAQVWDEVQNLFAALEKPAKAIRRKDSKVSVNRSENWKFFSPSKTVAAFSICIILLTLQPRFIQNLQSDYHTGLGEQKQIDLQDGSRLLLNTDSAVTVSMKDDARKVNLLRGEAYFEVAHAAQWPFWVMAGEAHARVTGTAFSVGRKEDHVTITVAEGRVETGVQAHVENIVPLTPGETASYQGQQLTGVQTTDIRNALAWRQEQMVFVQASLAEVVEQINRYRPGRLVILDQKLKDRPITAVFSINKLDDAVNALQLTFGIRARKLTDYWIFLG